MSSHNVEIARALFEALQLGDEEALQALADPDIEIHPSWDSLSVGVARGHEELRKFWREWPSFWFEHAIKVRQFIDAGEQVVIILHERARTRPGSPEVEDEFAHVWTVRGGKITRVDIYGDRSEALGAAGVHE